MGEFPRGVKCKRLRLSFPLRVAIVYGHCVWLDQAGDSGWIGSAAEIANL